MAEYIEREALITKFKKMELGEHGLVERLFADGVYAVIAAFPAADVAPVRHGRWIDVREKQLFGDHYFLCSNCKSRNGSMISFNYCPNCGAKIQEVE